MSRKLIEEMKKDLFNVVKKDLGKIVKEEVLELFDEDLEDEEIEEAKAGSKIDLKDVKMSIRSTIPKDGVGSGTWGVTVDEYCKAVKMEQNENIVSVVFPKPEIAKSKSSQFNTSDEDYKTALKDYTDMAEKLSKAFVKELNNRGFKKFEDESFEKDTLSLTVVSDSFVGIVEEMSSEHFDIVSKTELTAVIDKLSHMNKDSISDFAEKSGYHEIDSGLKELTFEGFTMGDYKLTGIYVLKYEDYVNEHIGFTTRNLVTYEFKTGKYEFDITGDIIDEWELTESEDN